MSMLIRALIVVLVILNLGAGLWWMSQPAHQQAPPVVASNALGVARLELLPALAAAPADTAGAAPSPAEPDEAAIPAPAPPAVPAVAAVAAPQPAPPAAPAVKCASFGSYASREAAQGAIAALAPQVSRSRVREVPGNAASYRVMLPKAASREEAQATVQRIVQAGIGDYYVIASGDDANAIALGRYRNREGAQRRLEQLTQAGFPAVLLPSGSDAAAAFWVDAAFPASADGAQLAAIAAAPRRQSLDCARLR